VTPLVPVVDDDQPVPHAVIISGLRAQLEMTAHALDTAAEDLARMSATLRTQAQQAREFLADVLDGRVPQPRAALTDPPLPPIGIGKCSVAWTNACTPGAWHRCAVDEEGHLDHQCACGLVLRGPLRPQGQ